MHKGLSFVFIFFMVVAGVIHAEKKLMRFPDVSDNHIVFTCGNDLWLVDHNGGLAKRITNTKGMESFARFSPDGSKIAYTAIFEDSSAIYTSSAIYVMDIEGGKPKRLTFHPAGGIVMDWYPDGKYILFRSNREYPFHEFKLYKIESKGGMPQKLPLPSVGWASISQNGELFVFNRLVAECNEYHERKRYTGGQAQDIWIGNLPKSKFKKITSYEGTDNFPMWYRDSIYFTSDRNQGTLNLYKFNIKDEKIQQLTFYDDYDVKYPSMGGNHIIFQHAQNLYCFNLETEKQEKVRIEMPSGFYSSMLTDIKAANYTGSFGLSPDGKRIIMDIRGEIINIPAGQGIVYNLTKSSKSREKNPIWSPNEKWIAFLSDRSGEEEIYLSDTIGKGKWKKVTKNGLGFRNQPLWSPDSTHIIFSDKFMRLNLVRVDTGKISVIDQGLYDDSWYRWGIQDYCWSPDSKWIAYTKLEKSLYESIFLYSIEKKKIFRVTGSLTQDFSPSFSKDGKYLYFLSNRTFNPIMGFVDHNHIFINMTRPYIVILQKDEPSPFYKQMVHRHNSILSKGREKPTVRIETKDLNNRIVPVPISAANLFRLESIDGGFLYLKQRTNEFLKYQNISDRDTNKNFDLLTFNISNQKNELLIERICQYHLSHDGKHLIYKSGRDFGVVILGKAKVGDGQVDLTKIKITVNKQEESMQIFNEAWRLQRDWFYDENMHGLNWVKMGEKYRSLVPYCVNREDLNYVIGELMSELNTGHTYVYGGDVESTSVVTTGFLGVDYYFKNPNSYPQIQHIIPGENCYEWARSPFFEPGCPIKEGDYLLAIDGIKIEPGKNIYKYFQNKGNKIVELLYNHTPEYTEAKKYVCKTLASEYWLRYNEFVKKNITLVNNETNSQVGYLHLLRIEQVGLGQFAKYFFPQYFKKGIIIDVRYNRGGFASYMIIDRLERVLNSYLQPREGQSSPKPERVFNGHMVLLINKYSGSAAEIFAEAFKNRKLGVVIGEKTWGGAIGTETHQRLVDNGRVTAPQFGRYNKKGEWIIEGSGVNPDIEIINMPDKVLNGEDEQLEKAIEVILQKIKNEPVVHPRKPKYPDKS